MNGGKTNLLETFRRLSVDHGASLLKIFVRTCAEIELICDGALCECLFAGG